MMSPFDAFIKLAASEFAQERAKNTREGAVTGAKVGLVYGAVGSALIQGQHEAGIMMMEEEGVRGAAGAFEAAEQMRGARGALLRSNLAQTAAIGAVGAGVGALARRWNTKRKSAAALVPFDDMFAFQQLRKMRVGGPQGMNKARVLRAGGAGAVAGAAAGGAGEAAMEHHQDEKINLGQVAMRAAEGAFVGGAAGAGVKAVLDVGRQGAASALRYGADMAEAVNRTGGGVAAKGHQEAAQAFHNIRTNPDIAAIGDFESRYGRKQVAHVFHPDHLAHSGLDQDEQKRLGRAYQLYNGMGGGDTGHPGIQTAVSKARNVAYGLDKAQEGVF